MNPDKVIKKWLRLVGSTFGNTEAHNYRWSDASTKAQVEYFTYNVTKMVESDHLPIKDYSKDEDVDTTLHRKSYKQWISTVKIDLYRSQNGMVELAKCITAAKDDNPNIKKIFSESGCSLLDSTDVVNLTPEDVNDDEGLKESYHQRVIVRFYENVSVSFKETNEVVEKVNITLGPWDKED